MREGLIAINADLAIPAWELEFSFVRSSGPGGQNVNKVNSKAVMRWDLAGSGSLSANQREKLIYRLSTRLTRSGELILSSDQFRDQARNREECIQKFQLLLRSALHEPKARKKSKPSRSSRKKAQEKKKKHSEKKASRRKVGF